MPRTVTERVDTLPTLAEVFRENGYAGASLSLIGKATGLGKGSLYHFFPGGKEEMVCAVLAQIDAWFEANVFEPLRDAQQPAEAISAMLDAVEDYFRSGRRVCLVGALALGEARDRFGEEVRGYFEHWVDALAAALTRSGRNEAEARVLAEDAVASIQGAIVLARALRQPDVFRRSILALRRRLGVP